MITGFLLMLFLRPLHCDWSSNHKSQIYCFYICIISSVTRHSQYGRIYIRYVSTLCSGLYVSHLSTPLWLVVFELVPPHVVYLFLCFSRKVLHSADGKVTLTLTHFIFMTFSFSIQCLSARWKLFLWKVVIEKQSRLCFLLFVLLQWRLSAH